MTSLRFRATGDAWLYDCHGQRFAPAEAASTVTSGFAPFFLSQLFGVPMAQWPALLQEALAASNETSTFDGWLARHQPKRSPSAALEIALLVYPSVERFIERSTGARAPFQLRDAFLFQPNVPLGCLQERTPEGWRDRAEGPSPRSVTAPPSEPGLYVLGHSTLLIRGGESGLLIDPIPMSPLIGARPAVGFEQLADNSTAVAITHAHFDHYHLPSLIALAGRTLVVPQVPRASIVCEDMAGRLREHGLESETPAWHETVDLGDIRLRVLPFVGEQFLTADEHPEARSWGNAYVAETDETKVFVAADCGFEPGRSVLDVARAHVAKHGSVDVLATQAIALRTTFGGGDPDLQLTALTCAHRATEALALQRLDARVTLAVSDVVRLSAILGAKTVVLYGQFTFAPGAPCVVPELVTAVRRALAAHDLAVWVPALEVGEGVHGNDLRRLA